MNYSREVAGLTKVANGTMFAQKVAAMPSSIVKRSAVYHLLNTIAPINHKLKAELDILGCTVVVAIVLCLVTMVRLVLLGVAQ
jgi:hypothetical protein